MKDLFTVKMDIQSNLENLDSMQKQMQMAWDNPEKRQKSAFKQIFRPMLIMMAVSGCYNFSDLNDFSTQDHQKSTWKGILSGVYRLIVFLLLLASSSKMAAGVYYLPQENKQMIGLCLIWSISLIFTFLVSLKTSSKKFGHYEAAFKFWEDKIIPEFKDLQLDCPVKSIKRRTLVTTIVATLCVILNVVGLGIQIHFGAGPLYLAPFEDTPFAIALFLFVLTVDSLVWLIPQANAIVTAKAISRLLQSFNKYLSETIDKETKTCPTNLRRIRLLHMNISKFVSDLDKDFGWLYGMSLGFTIAIFIFGLYQVIKTDMNTITYVMYFFWLSIGLAQIGLITIFAAFVNDEVSSVYYFYHQFFILSLNKNIPRNMCHLLMRPTCQLDDNRPFLSCF